MFHNQYNTSGIFPERHNLAIRRQCQVILLGSHDSFGIGNIRYSKSSSQAESYILGVQQGPGNCYIFNSLPSQIKELCHNRNQFKRALKKFLYFHLFYTLDEYFSCNKI